MSSTVVIPGDLHPRLRCHDGFFLSGVRSAAMATGSRLRGNGGKPALGRGPTDERLSLEVVGKAKKSQIFGRWVVPKGKRIKKNYRH